VEIDLRKIVDPVLTDRQSDAVLVHRFHSRDGDGYLLAPKEVTFLEDNVGDVMVAPIDDQPFDLAYPAIGCVDVLAPLDGHLADRQSVRCHRQGRVTPEIGPQQHIFGVVARVALDAREESDLFSDLEPLELGSAVVQVDVIVAGLDSLYRDQPSDALPMFRLDHQMSDRVSDRIEHHLGHAAAFSVGTVRLDTNRERRGCTHSATSFVEVTLELRLR
jgi:hypothetical protein